MRGVAASLVVIESAYRKQEDKSETGHVGHSLTCPELSRPVSPPG